MNLLKFLVNVSILLMVTCALFYQATFAQAAVWRQTAPLATSRFKHTANLLPNGKVLIVGGATYTAATNTYRDLAEAELYDPLSNTWSSAGKMATARYGHTSTLLPNGKVLVTGGTTTSGQTQGEIYDPSSNSWTTGDINAESLAYSTATLLNNGNVLFVGGTLPLSDLADSSPPKLYDYKANNSNFTAVTNTYNQYYITNNTSTLLPDGTVLITGGSQNTGNNYYFGSIYAQVWLYDPASDSWKDSTNDSSIQSMAHARALHSAVLLANGKVLVTGGQDVTSNYYKAISSSELYDPVTRTWSRTVGDLNINRMSSTTTLLPDGTVLAVGGIGGAYSESLKSVELYDPVTSKWTITAPLVTDREGHTATLLPNGNVLVVGGFRYIYTNGSGPLASTELYDPTMNSWSLAAPSNNGYAYFASCTLVDGKILVVGRNKTMGELYDPGANSWVNTGLLQTPREYATATLLNNGKVLVTGGYNINAGGYLASAELYDPASNSFSNAGNMKNRRGFHTATLLNNGKVMVIGGTSNQGDYGSILSSDIYDPVNNSWSQTGTTLYPRYGGHTVTLLADGRLLVVGGGVDRYDNTWDLELYDPINNVWSSVGVKNSSISGHSATLLPSGEVLISGGGNSFLRPLGSFLYNPTNNSWRSPKSTSAYNRTDHTATLLPSGTVLVTGGKDATNILDSAEIYDPTTEQWNNAAKLSAARYVHQAALLNNGKVLISGGLDSASTDLNSAELFAPDLGFSNARRPVVAKTENVKGKIAFSGSGFRGDSEGSSGTTNSSATNFPLLQFRRLSNEQSFFVLSDSTTPWTYSSFTAQLPDLIAPGLYCATIYANAIPSISQVIKIGAASNVTPIPLEFGLTAINSPSTKSLTITNSGNGSTPMKVTGATLAGNDSSLFTINPGDGTNGSCGSLMPTLAAGVGCTISVTFSPVAGGTRNALLTITSNDLEYPFLEVPVSGTAAHPVSVTVTGGNGSINCPPLVAVGTIALCTITPVTGYHLATFSDSDVDKLALITNGIYSLGVVTTSRSILGTFDLDTFSLTFGTSGNGSLTGATNQMVNYGSSSSTVTAVPAVNHHLVNWTGTNGFVTTTNNSLTVTNVMASQTITAIFAIDTFEVYSDAGAKGTITPKSSQFITVGQTTSFSVEASPGYQIASVTGCDGTLSGNIYTTAPITANCTINSTFSLIPPVPVPSGDVNGDGRIDVIDAILTLQYVVGQMPSSTTFQAIADVFPLDTAGVPRGDGKVDISDALTTLRRAIKLENWSIFPSYNGTASPQGGTFGIGGHSITIPIGSLTSVSKVSVSETSDPEVTAGFGDGTWYFGPETMGAETEFQVKIENAVITKGASFKIIFNIPDALTAKINASNRFSLLYLETYTSDDPDHGETLDTWTPAKSIAYDASLKTLSGVISGRAFRFDAQGTATAIIKAAIVPILNATTPVAKQVLKNVDSLAVCANPPTTEAPGANMSLVNPLNSKLIIVGPYSEPEHSDGFHKGIDFRATNNSVYAARDGFIETIRVSGCTSNSTQAVCTNTSDANSFYFVIRHPDLSATVYHHLKKFSAIYNNVSIPEQLNGYWAEPNPRCPKYPVKAGDHIATSGKTGAPGGPHLHFGLATAGNPNDVADVINPVLRLGKVMAYNLTTQKYLTMTSPDTYSLTVTPEGVPPGSQEIGLTLFDNTPSSEEIVVRRKKSPEKLLSVLAKSDQFEYTTNPLSRSNWPVVEVQWVLDDGSINGPALQLGSTLFPNYIFPNSKTTFGFETDAGFAKIGVFGVTPDLTPVKAAANVFAVESADTVTGSKTVVTDTTGDKKTVTFNVNFQTVDFSGTYAFRDNGTSSVGGSNITFDGTMTVSGNTAIGTLITIMDSPGFGDPPQCYKEKKVWSLILTQATPTFAYLNGPVKTTVLQNTCIQFHPTLIKDYLLEGLKYGYGVTVTGGNAQIAVPEIFNRLPK